MCEALNISFEHPKWILCKVRAPEVRHQVWTSKGHLENVRDWRRERVESDTGLEVTAKVKNKIITALTRLRRGRTRGKEAVVRKTEEAQSPASV